MKKLLLFSLFFSGGCTAAIPSVAQSSSSPTTQQANDAAAVQAIGSAIAAPTVAIPGWGPLISAAIIAATGLIAHAVITKPSGKAA